MWWWGICWINEAIDIINRRKRLYWKHDFIRGPVNFSEIFSLNPLLLYFYYFNLFVTSVSVAFLYEVFVLFAPQGKKSCSSTGRTVVVKRKRCVKRNNKTVMSVAGCLKHWPLQMFKKKSQTSTNSVINVAAFVIKQIKLNIQYLLN